MLDVFRDKIVTKGGREKGFGMAGLDSGCLILANAVSYLTVHFF
jgi:hypothetical protein